MDLAKQGGSFVPYVESVVEHAEGELYDEECYNDDADNLVRGVEVFGLRGVSAVQSKLAMFGRDQGALFIRTDLHGGTLSRDKCLCPAR